MAGPYDGTLFNPWFPKYGYAVGLAVDHTNDPDLFPDIFPNHELVCHQIKVGQFVINKDFIVEGLNTARETSTLGMGHINSFSSGVTMNVMLA
jgi:hypothetical protein